VRLTKGRSPETIQSSAMSIVRSFERTMECEPTGNQNFYLAKEVRVSDKVYCSSRSKTGRIHIQGSQLTLRLPCSLRGPDPPASTAAGR
jgi:hypothetical protein